MSYEIIAAREIEIEDFQEETYKALMGAMRKFISEQDLYDGDLIGLNFMCQDNIWYGIIVYSGAPIEIDKDDDDPEEKLIKENKTSFMSHSMTVLNKPRLEIS